MGLIKNPQQTDMLGGSQIADDKQQWPMLAYQHIVDGVLFLDANTGVIQSANHAACRLTGHPVDQLVGAHYSILFNQPEAQIPPDELLDSLQVVDNNFLSVDIEKADGSILLADISAAVIETPDKTNAILLILRDATESDTMRRNLYQTLHALKQRGAELDIFTRTISHDLQSPLVTVDSFLQLMQRQVARNEMPDMEDMNDVRQAVNRMSDLLRGLLNLARSGKRIGERQPCKIADITTQACKMLQGKIRHYKARVQIADDLPVVWGDNLRLLQVQLNLIDNALKYHRADTPPAIRIASADTPSGKAFCIHDNGLGINSEDQYLIFENFTRIENATEGSGMGLATVHSIIEQHGGKVWVESQGLDTGATFYISLPEVQL